MPAFDVVIPTIGRDSLRRTLEALMEGPGPLPNRVIVVDDRLARPNEAPPLPLPDARLENRWCVEVVTSGGRGPAAARNVGWQVAESEWVAFLDDDVIPTPGWRSALAADLSVLGAADAGSQGRVHVPLPADRLATDWERNVAGLSTARWITADMAYRRSALACVGGFDERFRYAYREDADLAARIRSAGGSLVHGTRSVVHPIASAPWWISAARQRGNRDDAWLRDRFGPAWRHITEAGPGRIRRHAAISGAATVALAAVAVRQRWLAAAAAGCWAAGTGELAAARIRNGPRTVGEVAAMLVTSVAIPPLATWHRLVGTVAVRRTRQSSPIGRARAADDGRRSQRSAHWSAERRILG